MSAAASLPNLAGAAWLDNAAVQAIFDALPASGESTRIVGGAVRNALAGEPVDEIDFATTLIPDRVVELAKAAGIKSVPTGIEHGTVTLVVADRAFEVTTLRQDIETDGRHAVVRFGRDWTEDAKRRDFTVNALSLDRDGTVHDPIGGLADIAARRVRFIGEAHRRIIEDRLRILRFFRFHASFARGEIDPDGVAAAIAERAGLRELSAERIGHEMRQLVVAPGAAETAGLMQDAGILPIVLGGIGYPATFANYMALARSLGAELSPAPGLAALGTWIADDAHRLFERLRLSGEERDRMLAAMSAADRLAPDMPQRAARAALYRLGPEAYRDGIVLAGARGAGIASQWRAAYLLPEQWQPPVFPLKGGDLVKFGVPHGPSVGTLLAELETWWVKEDFKPDEAALRIRLQQQLAAVQ